MNKDFFNRNAEVVARELLGKIIFRKINDNGVIKLRARIVETEAYFDENDPASRARQNGDLKETMKMQAGTILVYGIHNQWLMNIVTNKEGVASAVLIRAVEPLNFEVKCSGPGLLTKSLKIDKNFHKKNILNNNEIWIEDNIGNNQFKHLESDDRGVREFNPRSNPHLIKNQKLSINNKDNNFEVVESFRIGVKEDLPKKLRFYIKNNPCVSRS